MTKQKKIKNGVQRQKIAQMHMIMYFDVFRCFYKHKERAFSKLEVFATSFPYPGRGKIDLF